MFMEGPMGSLNDTDFALISRAYRYIAQKGTTYVDGSEALGSNTVVNAAIAIDTKFKPPRGRQWVNAYLRWGDRARAGHRLTVIVNTQNGSLQVKEWPVRNADDVLAEQIGEDRIPALAQEVFELRSAKNDGGGPIEVPDDEKDPSQGGGEGGVNWDPLIELAAAVGKDVHQLVRGLLTGEHTVVNTIGRAPMRRGDRLCVWLANADDHAEVYLDKELVASRSLNEPVHEWEYSDPVKAGTHLVLVVVRNAGRFDWSVNAHLARQSDYVKGGSRRPFKVLQRADTDHGLSSTRLYYLKLNVA
jgi:hypothetical protein